MRNNKALAWLIAAVVVVGLGAVIIPRVNNDDASATPTAIPTASPTANPEFVSYDGVEGQTALATLKAKYTVETKQFSFGEMVQSINGLAADDTHYWGFYVNGTMAAVGAGDYTAKAGDKIEFRYEKLQ